MVASEIIPKNIQKAIATAVYIAGGAFSLVVIGIWTIVLLNLTKAIQWPTPLTESAALIIFGVTVAISCAMMWFLNHISILKLRVITEKAIWRVLIVSILTTVATAIVKAFK